jgi:ArsR family transcriptional regulator
MSPRKTSACSTGSRATSATRIAKPDLEMYESMLKALANPIRLRMVDLIRRRGGDVCVCEFGAVFKLTQPTISHHLKILRESGLIVSRQEGTWVHHSIDPRAFGRLEELMSVLSAAPVAT